MRRKLAALVALGALIVLVLGGWFVSGWYGAAEVEADTAFIIPDGSSLTAVAGKLEDEGLIVSADAFLLRARVLGGGDPIQAGEFLLPAGISSSGILEMFQNGDVLRRFVTIPEGTPSVMVHDILMAEELLTGDIPVPAEGSVLPESYDFERGESRAAVLARMRQAMDAVLAELWPERSPRTVVGTPAEAVILASIVEKETGVPGERRMVAGLYSNRLRQGMRLESDPTFIYPITRGRPIGRRLRRSDIDADNAYNTYRIAGLPIGPITNPGRESIAAVLDPAQTDAIFMVADGSGGHEFNATLAGHNAAVTRWRALRQARGE